jgi:hypothetical protein
VHGGVGKLGISERKRSFPRTIFCQFCKETLPPVHGLTVVQSIELIVCYVSAKRKKMVAVTVLTNDKVFSDRNLNFSKYSDCFENKRQVQ